MSVTYGAGGGTSDFTVSISENLEKKFDVPVLAHLSCISSTREVRLDQIERYLGMGGVSAEGELSREIDRCRPLIMNAVNAMYDWLIG